MTMPDYLYPYIRDLTKVHCSKSEAREILEELVTFTALQAREGAFKDLRKIVRKEMVKWYQPKPKPSASAVNSS